MRRNEGIVVELDGTGTYNRGTILMLKEKTGTSIYPVAGIAVSETSNIVGALETSANGGDVVNVRTFMDGTLSVMADCTTNAIAVGDSIFPASGKVATVASPTVFTRMYALEKATTTGELIEVVVVSPGATVIPTP